MPYLPWDEAAPAGTDPADQIDTYIQQVKIAVRERMVSLGVTDWDTADPVIFALLALGGLTPYIKGDSTSTELSIRDDTGVTKFVLWDLLTGKTTFQAPVVVSGQNASITPEDKGNVTGAVTVDWADGNNQHMTFTGNVTFTFNNPVVGSFYFLRIAQDGTGSRLVTWPGNVKFADGLITTLTTTASKVDCVGMYYDGTNYLAWFVGRSFSV